MSRHSSRPGVRDARAGRHHVARARWPGVLSPVLIVIAGCLAYSNSLDGAFVFDDEPAIVENAHIRRLLPLREALDAPPGTTVSGRPTIALTLAINFALTPRDARGNFSDPRSRRGYHVVNLLVHLACGLLLCGVVRRTLLARPIGPHDDAHAAGIALSASLIWVVHPLTTSAVTYVIQRAESMMALMYLATLYCSIRAWERQLPWTPLAVVACAIGMGAKESMVTAPLAVVLWDYTFANERGRRWRLYTALAGTWILLALLVSQGHRPDAAGFGFVDWPWWRYLITQAGVFLHYLALVVVPWPLVFDYDWPAAVPSLLMMAQIAAVSTVAGLTPWLVWRRHRSGFAAAMVLLLLAPTSSVFPIVTEVAAEHRMYLPLAAIVAMIVSSGDAFMRRARVSAAVGFAAVALTIVLLSQLTMARNRDYQSASAIWQDTIAKRPSNARARNNYATLLLADGRYGEAESHLRAALATLPNSAEALNGLGVALCAQGRFDEGIAQFERALVVAPTFAAAEQSLGEAYATQGQMRPAVEHYERALRQRPDDVMLLNRIGWILATDADDSLRDGSRALALAERALGLTVRRDVTSLDTAAAALAELQKFDAAATTAREALALARSQDAADIVPELEQRLRLYESGRSFRQSPFRR